MIRRPPRSPLFPYTTLSRPRVLRDGLDALTAGVDGIRQLAARTATSQQMTEVTRELRSEEHTSELQSQSNLVCRLLLEKKKTRESRRSHALLRQCQQPHRPL